MIHSVILIGKTATARIVIAAGAKSARRMHFADNCLVDSLPVHQSEAILGIERWR